MFSNVPIGIFGSKYANFLYIISLYFKGSWIINPYIARINNDNAHKYRVHLGLHIALIILTGGLWYFIWIYRATEYTNLTKEKDLRDPTNKLLLCIFIPFYIFFWTYNTAVRIDAIAEEGFKGIFTGGLAAASFGITIAMLMGAMMAVIFQPRG